MEEVTEGGAWRIKHLRRPGLRGLNSLNKGVPLGNEEWKNTMVDRFKLQATMREKGRPKKCS